MKKSKKIAILSMLSIIICLLIVSPFTAYASTLDADGLPTFSFTEYWESDYMQA